MNILDLAIARKSVRTFDGNRISNEEINKILEYCKTIKNPYNIPVEFLVLDAEKHGLSSPVITGGNTYITAKVPKIAHCEEALGYSFELMVLYAWSLGIGTTWIGGTMNRDAFEKASQLKDDEIMPCVSPLGYPAKKRSLKEIGMRTAIRADKRISEKEMFFENDFSTPLIMADAIVKNALEAVKYAPSAVNKQPWRIVKTGNTYHFYEHRTLSKNANSEWDIQKVDIGIALCHFMEITDGKVIITDPHIEIPKDTEYIASVMV